MTSPHNRQRRLSGRRGSVSASDPWALHMTPIADTQAASSSRITIVRVPSTSGTDSEGDGPQRHRRSSSGASSASVMSGRSSPGARLSFAFSTFTPINPPAASPAAPAVVSAPSSVPTSPGTTFKRSNSSGSLHRLQSMQLPPAQLVDLAAAAVQPGNAPSGMRPCPDEVLLPFLNRPEEVSTLLKTPPTSKLFALLQALFLGAPSTPRIATNSMGTSSGKLPAPDMDSDPTTWTFAQLSAYMMTTPRSVHSDFEWVHCVRVCIQGRSEALWERFKGALGVPPELEEEDDGVFTDDEEEEEFHVEHPVVDDSTGVTNPPQAEEAKVEPGAEIERPTEEEKEKQVAIAVEYEGEVFIQPLYVTSKQDSSHFVLSPAGMSPSSSSHPLRFGFGGVEGGMQSIGENEEDATPAAAEEEGGKKEEEEEEEPPIHAIQIHATAFVPLSSANTSPILNRSSSTTASSSTHHHIPRSSSAMSFRSPQLGGRALSGSFHPSFERGPGNPLFPSSFAGLSIGPTLVANNPSLRYDISSSVGNNNPQGIPRRRFTSHGGHGSARAGMGTGATRPSWGDVYRTKYEYAVTAASASSDGGRA